MSESTKKKTCVPTLQAAAADRDHDGIAMLSLVLHQSRLPLTRFDVSLAETITVTDEDTDDLLCRDYLLESRIFALREVLKALEPSTLRDGSWDLLANMLGSELRHYFELLDMEGRIIKCGPVMEYLGIPLSIARTLAEEAEFTCLPGMRCDDLGNGV